MPLATDIGSDFQIFDNIELVTYQSRTPTGGITSYPSIRALRRALRSSLQTTGVQQTPDLAKWHIDASSLTEVLPKRGDRIVSTTGTYEIINDNIVTLATRYEVETIKR